jgi:hypothetical protein
LLRHCEERSDEAIQKLSDPTGLLRFARNDELGQQPAKSARNLP